MSNRRSVDTLHCSLHYEFNADSFSAKAFLLPDRYLGVQRSFSQQPEDSVIRELQRRIGAATVGHSLLFVALSLECQHEH